MMEGGAREKTGTRVDQPEGGAREKTGGIWRRRNQERPRPQPRQRPTVEPTEGGAMVEEGLTTPGGPTDGSGAGGGARGGDRVAKIRGDTEDPGGQGGIGGTGDRGRGRAPEDRSGAGATEDKGGAGRRKEPKGAQPEEWSPEAMAGQCPTKVEPEERGSPVEIVGDSGDERS
ncbi:hypothetical protein QQF64_026117 [Cirrhinus molitorella]|uniref:Uncharacterized protein n=1 Tax=Cirrhinus molitorella TaxID=172907 RepID=A0ABR3NR91_9TELE